MPKFKVVASAHYLYEVEADDDELAIDRAMQLMDDGWDGDPLSLFEWVATEQKEDNA